MTFKDLSGGATTPVGTVLTRPLFEVKRWSLHNDEEHLDSQGLIALIKKKNLWSGGVHC